MTDDSEVARIAAGLTKAQRDRLLTWPHAGSCFRKRPDAVAHQLCVLGIGKIMPWKYGKQMGLMPLGRSVLSYLQSKGGDA